MDPPDNQPKFRILLAFVEARDGAPTGNVEYCKYGAAGLEPINGDGSIWEDESQ